MKDNLPIRKPTRLKDYDYSSAGAYFITVCTQNKEKILCDIVGEGLCALPSVKLTSIGTIVKDAIEFINENYNNVYIDKYVIMPNHIHLIAVIKTGGDGTPPLQKKVRFRTPKKILTGRDIRECPLPSVKHF